MPKNRLILALVLAATGAADSAVAQTAAQDGIITQGRYCLEHPAPAPSGGSLPPRARVTVSRCAGRPEQRWTQLWGDYDWITSDARGRLSVHPSRRNGRWDVVLSDGTDPELHFQGETLRTPDDLCVTRVGERVWAERCRPGDARQRWQFR